MIGERKQTLELENLLKNLPSNFFTLTDSLTVARTRSMIEGQQIGLDFPKKSKT